MEFGIFYEHQLPRPWRDGDEHRLYREALEQVELADQLGIDYAWEVEHHFLEEYSHSSAPEVFLAAAAQRTEQIRLGHGIKLMPPRYNHPARAAEQVATLDLVSDGRVEFGTGESGSNMELQAFGIPVEEKYGMWQEAVRQVTDMMSVEPYPGHDGEYFSMPARNVLPKPVQEPHPPLWMACSSREMIEVAARNGVGALCFAFLDPSQAREWVDTYYTTLKEECVPIGRSVNPNIAMVTGFSCHPDEDEAWNRGAEGFAFFQWALAYYYVFGTHKPGHSNLWKQFQEAGGLEQFHPQVNEAAIGTPSQILESLQGYSDAGVDQVIFIQQGGKNEHEHICSSLELFADEVLPEFSEDKERKERRDELEPYIEEALERREYQEGAGEEEVPQIEPYDRDITKYI